MTHYEVLGISESASAATIRSTYLRLVQIYHPDHNADPEAHRKTAEIIAAYSVLSDPQKRADYDFSLRQGKSETRAPDPEPAPREHVIAPIVCQACSTRDATLRISLFYWVASLIVLTRRGGKSGLWCERCRAKQAAVWSIVTGVLGWWGFPWGPIYTIPALYENALGGKQDSTQNALLLRTVGFQLFQNGNLQEALRALDFSLALEKDEPTIQFANSLRAMPGCSYNKRFPTYNFLTAIPSVAVVILFAIAIVGFANRPTGYASRFDSAERTSPPIATSTTESSTAREKVNAMADDLAKLVAAHATPTGSHLEGTTTINEYELDRAKYTPIPFESVANKISPFLGDSAANADGFASSAYFNARLMALSIAIMNKFDSGQDISPELSEVRGLGEDDRIQPWLMSSKYYPSFLARNKQLTYMLAQQHLGVSRAESQRQLERLDKEIEDAKVRIKDARIGDNADDEHYWVRTHNSLVATYNALVTRSKRAHVAHEKVDLAFNRCLDPAILMSKYQQVNLTSSSQTIDALPTE